MAFIYEVNGQRVEFEKEPTEKDIDEAARALAPVPKPTRKVVEGAGGGAIIYPNMGRRPESQQNREASKEMPIQTARGVVTGTLGAIPDILNLPGTIYSGVTGNEAPYKVPLGSEEWNQMLPFQSDTPQARLARFGGEVLAPVPTVKGVKAIAPAAKYAYDLGKDVAGVAISPVQSAKKAVESFGRGYANPTNVGGEGSALMPIREQFYPHEQVAEFQAGQRTPLQMSEVPTSTITQNNTLNRFATNMSPTNKAGEALVAPKGRGLEGYFENLGATYKGNPYLAALDVASTIGGLAAGVGPTPITALSKSVPALAARQLQKATQFEPNFSADAIKAAQARSMFDPLQNPIPMQQPLALPAPTGPVRPTQTMYVNPEGVATTNVQGTQTNYTPRPASSGNFGTVRYQNQTAAQQSQQMAAQKLQEIQAKQQATQSLEQQTILDKIRARKNQPPPPEGGTPVVNNPPPTNPPAGGGSMFDPANTPSSIESSIDALPSDRFSLADKLALKRAKLQNNTPVVETPMTAAQEAAAKADFEKQNKVATKEYADSIIRQHIKGAESTGSAKGISPTEREYDTIPLDTGGFPDNARLTRYLKQLQKAQVDSLPVIPGMTEEQVVTKLWEELTNKGPKTKITAPTETKSTLSLKEALNKVNTKNETKTTNARPENVSKEDWAKLNETGKVRPYDQTDPVGNIEQALESTKRLIEKRDIKKKYGLETNPMDANLEQSLQKFENKLKDPIKLIQDELDNVRRDVAQRNSELASGGIPKGKSYGDLDGRLAKLEQRLIDAQKTTSSKAPKNVSKMVMGDPKATGPLEQSLVSKRSFNGDLQKYRYGSEKSPLTLEEYNHLKNSEFIDKQNTRDIIMGMRPELTEYSIWYKDKSGKIQNIQTYGNEFKKK